MAYRHLKVTKTVGRKKRVYKNLAVFNSECGKRTLRGNLCDLTNIRKLRDGGGLAVVNTYPGALNPRPGGTWRLHFASYEIMKNHLRGRVGGPRSGALDGSKRRRRKR